ncbi:MAG: choice-of-anchor E domain-containing protein [Methanothrix sp.]
MPRSLLRGCAAAVSLAGFFYSGACMAENLEYCYDHPLSIGDWSDNATLPKFDSSLGKITDVHIRMNYTLAYNFSLKNIADYAANTSIDIGGNLSLTLPDNTSLTIDAEGNRTVSLSPNETASSSESINRSRSFDLSSFDGFAGSSSGETIILPLTVSTHSSTLFSGDIMTELKSHGAASVCITYEFVPAKGAQINLSENGGEGL